MLIVTSNFLTVAGLMSRTERIAVSQLWSVIVKPKQEVPVVRRTMLRRCQSVQNRIRPDQEYCLVTPQTGGILMKISWTLHKKNIYLLLALANLKVLSVGIN